jgi:large subunit ribosomal protein L4
MRRLALRCVLSAKISEGELKVVERLELEEPKTKEMSRILTALGAVSSALIATSEPEDNVVKSARNIPRIKTTPADILNVVDILSYKMLLMTEAAIRKAEQLWGERLPQGGNHAPV